MSNLIDPFEGIAIYNDIIDELDSLHVYGYHPAQVILDMESFINLTSWLRTKQDSTEFIKHKNVLVNLIGVSLQRAFFHIVCIQEHEKLRFESENSKSGGENNVYKI